MPDKTTHRGLPTEKGKIEKWHGSSIREKGGQDLFYDESCTGHGVPPGP